MEEIKVIREIFFKKMLCHSFLLITVIPFGLLSFLPDYCHSFHISVIPSELMSFLPNYCHFKYFSSWIAPVPSHTQRTRKMATGGGHIRELLLNLLNIRGSWHNPVFSNFSYTFYFKEIYVICFIWYVKVLATSPVSWRNLIGCVLRCTFFKMPLVG